MHGIALFGATGRMGRAILPLLARSDELSLTGALASAGNPAMISSCPRRARRGAAKGAGAGSLKGVGWPARVAIKGSSSRVKLEPWATRAGRHRRAAARGGLAFVRRRG